MSKKEQTAEPSAAGTPGRTYIVAMTVGSVGKTAFARHILHAYMPAARLISVESATPDEGATDLYQRGQAEARAALRFELFSRLPNGKIVDCGVTDSEMIAEVIAELAAIGRAGHITMVLPVLVESKGLRGLEHFGGLLPTSVRKVAVLTQVEDAAADVKFRASKYGHAVEVYCKEHRIALCPIPFLHSDLLDTSSAVHTVAMSGRTLEEVRSIDLDALATGAGPHDRAAAAQLGLLIGAAAMAPSAIENTRAIFDWIMSQENGNG